MGLLFLTEMQEAVKPLEGRVPPWLMEELTEIRKKLKQFEDEIDTRI